MKRWIVAGGIALVLFAAVVLATVLLPPSAEGRQGSLTNPQPGGTRAVGEVLRANGVNAHQVTTLVEASAAPAESTLLVYLSEELNDTAVLALNQSKADLVIVVATSNSPNTVGELTDYRIQSTGYSWNDDAVDADCADPDATAAGSMTSGGANSLSIQTGVIGCFEETGGDYRYALAWQNGRRVTVVSGDDWLRNQTILTAGNAALALRVLGRDSELVWYLPGLDATGTQSAENEPDIWSALPPWVRVSVGLFAFAAGAAALWQGRRFGKLVPENLPVEMPASEAGTGLARLYRQAKATGHAAAGLRAASLHRLARRLGLSSKAEPAAIIERLAQASGLPADQLRALYYGRAPANDLELVALATELSELERRLTHSE